MKKITIFLVAAITFISCGNTYKAHEVTLNSETDSINHTIGLVTGMQIKAQMLRGDTTDEAVAEFIDALDAAYWGQEEQISSVAQAGQQLGGAAMEYAKKGLASNSAWPFNAKLFFQGFVNALYDDTLVMTHDEANAYFMQAYRRSSDGKAGKAITGKCPKKAKKVALKSFNDSINYALGYLQGMQDKVRILADEDESAYAELIENANIMLKSGARNPFAVLTAKSIGKVFRDQEPIGLDGVPGLETKFDIIKQGFVNGLYEDFEMMNATEASRYIQQTLNQIKFGNTKEQGEHFLAENALKEGVKVTESGLQYEVIKMGKGPKPGPTDRVKVHYHGTLIDGTVFDSSVERGEPIVFGLNQVIAGWTEGVQLMPVGSKFKFYIPQNLGYGERAAGSIPPYSTLIFEVELLDIEK